MESSAILGMVMICGTIIGGFIYFLSFAIRNEKSTTQENKSSLKK